MNASRTVLRSLLAGVLAALVIVPASQAMTLEQTQQSVSGITGSKWFIGDSGQTYGTNCANAILGTSYPEVMEMAYSSYGGVAGVVRTGNKYWAAMHMAVTGNPCPKGSDIIFTDLALPPDTSIDGSRPIRCFSTQRNSSDFYESTNEGWDMRPIGINAYGRTCPNALTPSATGHGVGLSYRGLASGQQFIMYVPVVSSQTLVGMGNKEHRFVWLIKPTLAYDYFGTQTWANVFPPGPAGPFIYFSRDPSVVPYWDKSAPVTPKNEQNRAELFANLYSNSQPGNLCYQLYAGTTATGSPILDCDGFTSAIPNTSDSFYVKGPGPNGGAVPFYFDPPDYGQNFTIQWTFTPSSGPAVKSQPITFKALSGPDEDGDGVANDGTDQCPTQKGEPPNGCPPPLNSADPDGDGLIGANDKCPNLAMIGSADGCPTLAATLGKLPAFKRAKLAKGVAFPVNCSLDTPVSAALTVSAAVAKKLKIKFKAGKKTVTIATARGSCSAKSGGKPKLKLASAARRPVTKSRSAIKANLTVTFTPGGGVTPVTAAKAVKLG
jgi:hypothetical protein